MQNLTRASSELFRRSPDECFDSLISLYERCQQRRERSVDHWHPPQNLRPCVTDGELRLAFGGEEPFEMNDWSFAQVCRLARVSKDTLNRLKPETAGTALAETLPRADKPVQILASGNGIRSVHGVAYTRLWDVDLLNVVREFATDFQPPQRAGFVAGSGIVQPGNEPVLDDDIPFEPDPGPRDAADGATGLYAGEQDMFCFLIDPLGWAEINGEAFAPGFFIWNSEVGKRSVGVQTFWFQKVCANHIVWDAVEVVEFSRKHTANVHESLTEIRRIIENLVTKRDERRDGFAKVVTKAMGTKLGNDAEEVAKVLTDRGIGRSAAKEALRMAERHGAFTIFAVVDALTRLAGKLEFAGDRTEADAKASRLLALAA